MRSSEEASSLLHIMIVDDHQLVIDGLLALLEAAPDMKVLATANDGSSILQAVQQQQPDLLILDIDMPGMSGRELAGIMKAEFPDTRLLALTMHNDRGVIQGMRQAGVSGYLLKNTSQDELLTAIRRLAAGKPYYSSEVTETLLQPVTAAEAGAASLSALTDREREILVLIAEGFTNAQIGEKLHISPRTVDSHRTNLMKKLAVHNMAGLIRFAYRQGLVE